MFLYIILAAICILVIFYKKCSDRYNHWSKLGIIGPKPTWFVGNVGLSLILQKTIGQIYTDIYNEYKDLPFVGVYRAFNPVLLVRDPEFIRDITVRMFSHFQDNDMEVDEKVDPLFSRNLFVLKGEYWKTVRSQVVPCFSSLKIKAMYPLLEKVGKDLIDYINIQKNPLEAKELCLKYTTDTIATCVFGLEGQSFTNPNSELRDIGKKFLSPGTWTSIKLVIIFIFPNMAKIWKIPFAPREVQDRLTSIVMQTIKYREENKIVRNDFIHFLVKIKENAPDKFTDMDLIAQAASFFSDGFETSALVMSYTLYEIASHREVQEKLRKEINDVLKKNQGKFSYDSIQDMPYLEAIICENLRKNPPLYHLGKMCTKDYTYTCEGGNFKNMTVHVKKDTPIVISIYGLQTDEAYFPNPLKFRPERFLGEDKKNITKGVYFPMGEGPRMCIGQKFGLFQVKVGLINIIRSFNVTVNQKTKSPIEIDTTSFMLAAKGGIWLDFQKI